MKECKYYDSKKAECTNVIERTVCKCEGNCASCDFFASIRSPECDHKQCAYNDRGVCVYAKAFGGANPDHGFDYPCFIPVPKKCKTFAVEYIERVVHHFEVEAEDAEEAEQLFWNGVSNAEYDFSDGELSDSEIKIKEKEAKK